MAVAPVVKRKRYSPPALSHEGVASSTPSSTQVSTTDDYLIRAAGWNLEQDYEQRPRKQRKKEKENTRLPIKTAEGRIEQLNILPTNDEDEDSWLGSEDGGDNEKVPDNVEVEAKVPIRQQIIEAKEELARIAGLINENPEEHAGGFRTLSQIAASSNPTIKRLALVTQLAVYKDAIPGYRIRPIAEQDQTDKVSKDVRRLRAFEQTLVNCYQGYIKDLAQCAKSVRGHQSEAMVSVTMVAVSCVCALLLAVPHFNFRGELLKILIARLSSREVDANFIKCREAVEHLFRSDEDGTSSLDAVSLITRMMKARHYQVHESVPNTFLHLRLLTEFSSKASQNRVDKPAKDEVIGGKKPKYKKGFRTKKERKTMKERKEVEKEFKEADAIVSHEQRDRMQSETLKLVFVTYFRILKARIPNLMGAVLEGLAKYAHLINQDFFGDLLEALKDMISDAEALVSNDEGEDQEQDQTMPSKSDRDSTREALLCITTAFTLLEGQDAARSATALNLDLTFFTLYLYRSLHDLSLNPELELSSKSLRLPDPHSPSMSSSISKTAPKINLQTTAVLLLRALTSILTPRAVPPIRLAAFTKQLFISSLQLPEKSTLAMLSLLNNVTKLHGRKIASMWNTEERKGDGVFNALRGDLEGSNPFASTIWEGELLKLHYAPGVRAGVKEIEKEIGGVK